jgi:hypothetical protein
MRENKVRCETWNLNMWMFNFIVQNCRNAFNTNLVGLKEEIVILLFV